MPITKDDINLFQIFIHINGTLSIIGSLASICSYLFVKEYRTHSNRLVFSLSLYDLLSSVFLALGDGGYKWYGNYSALCNIQATMVQIGLVGSMLLSGTKSLNLLLVYLFRFSLEDLTKLEKYYHFFIFLIASVPAISFNFINTPPSPIYGDSTFWCWITAPFPWLRFAFFYALIWFIWVVNFFIYLYVGRDMWMSKKALKQFTHKNSKNNLQSSNNVESTVTAAQKKATSQLNRPLQIYIRNCSLYLLGFMITWFWGSVNRIQNIVDPTNPIPVLFALHAFFTPLQGFNNFVVYSITTFHWWKRFIPHWWKRIGKPSSTSVPLSKHEIEKGSSRVEIEKVTPNQI